MENETIMKTSIENIALIATTISLAIMFVAGLYERFVNIPRWFANPPSSFGLINQHTKSAVRFWIPIQILFFASFITAFITNWNDVVIRNYLFLTAISFALIIITTAAYFAKEIMAFAKMEPDEPLTQELKQRAHKWLRWTGVRNLLHGIGLLFLILAL